MLAIVSAVYEMMQNTQIIQSVVNKQVDRFFEKMDTDRDGMVSREEFMSNCKNVWNNFIMSHYVKLMLLVFNARRTLFNEIFYQTFLRRKR